MTNETLSVPEIHCGHCVASIEGALRPLGGVVTADVDLPSKTVKVSFDEASVSHQAIVDAIVEQGYEVA